MSSDSTSAPSPARVVAVTATYRRAAELRRLLDSLAASTLPLHAIVIVDNAGEEEIRALAAASATPAEYLRPGANLGCGGGLRAGEARALEKYGDALTHLWILDDDVEIRPATLGRLVETMAAEQADVVHPLVVNAEGWVSWIPGFLDRGLLLSAQRERFTPEAFRARAGCGTLPFSWAQGIALLVGRSALDRHGLHRGDFWVRGEDLEFSLRLTYRGKGLCVLSSVAAHLPPEPANPGSTEGEYEKHRAMLQNIAYVSLRLPHGRRIASTIPGNWLRFLRTWRWGLAVWRDAMLVFWRGAVLGKPAGVQ